MSDSSRPNDKPQPSGEQREVLTSLPRHRPQRLTARREANRASQAAKKPSAKPVGPTAASPSKAAKAPKPKVLRAKPVSPPPQRPAPKQGFDIDDPQLGRSVEPPNGSEILLSALRLSGSVAQGSISTGGRLLKGALRRLH